MASMDISDAQKRQVVEAVAKLLRDNPKDKVPNVAVVQALVGFEINAAQRDEALATHRAEANEMAKTVQENKQPEQKDAEPKVTETAEPAPSAQASTQDESGSPMVTNNWPRKLTVNEVVIQAGETKPVPGFHDMPEGVKKHTYKLWAERGTITVK